MNVGATDFDFALYSQFILVLVGQGRRLYPRGSRQINGNQVQALS